MSAIRVLIADRDKILLATYGRFLADHGVEASFASSGLDCIARLRDSCLDVLVLEPGLLWGGAAGVLDRMYGERDLPAVPVILLAAASDADQLCHALEFPIDEFMVRPVSPMELLERIHRVRYSNGPNAHVELPSPWVAMQYTY